MRGARRRGKGRASEKEGEKREKDMGRTREVGRKGMWEGRERKR